jgi:hypothetical protein
MSIMSRDTSNLDDLMSEPLPPNRRPPSHRHAIPSGPWPWIDINTPIPVYRNCKVEGWQGYPQALYHNWLPDQVDRAQIGCARDAPWIEPCTIYPMIVIANGEFIKNNPEVYYPDEKDKFWARLHNEVVTYSKFRFKTDVWTMTGQ